jgi:hypothetical protein
MDEATRRAAYAPFWPTPFAASGCIGSKPTFNPTTKHPANLFNDVDFGSKDSHRDT